MQYLFSVNAVQWRFSVVWSFVDTFQGLSQGHYLLRGRKTGVVEDFLRTYAAWGAKSGDRMRAYLSLVYSYITLFLFLFTSIRPNTLIPSVYPVPVSICQPPRPHRQVGRGLSQRSPHEVPTFLDSWIPGFLDIWFQWVRQRRSAYNVERAYSAETSSTSMVPHLSPPGRYSRRKRKCRRWRQRSREYRRRRSTSRNRIRRHRRHLSNFIRDAHSYKRVSHPTGWFHLRCSALLDVAGVLFSRFSRRSQDLFGYFSTLGSHSPTYKDISPSPDRVDSVWSRQEIDFLRRRRSDRGGGGRVTLFRGISRLQS